MLEDFCNRSFSSSLLIDTHCHLDMEVFSSDLDDVVVRALSAGIGLIITISTRVCEFDRIRFIAEKYKHVFCSVGTHPCNVSEEEIVRVNDLVKLAHHPKVVAIGETGLDYHHSQVSVDQQKYIFLNHIVAARKTGLPLIVHSRNADKEMEEILKNEIKKDAFSFVLHCYSSGIKLAKAAVDLGGFLSFSGILTFKNAQDIREIAKITPQDRVLVETDAPYLAPVPFRGQRNEPSFVLQTVKVLADILKKKNEDVIEMTTSNALHFFDKMAKANCL